MTFAKCILTILLLSIGSWAIAQPQAHKYKNTDQNNGHETPESILKYFQNKDIDKIVACATYPFKMDVGGTKNDGIITDPATLRKRLTSLYQKDWFSDIKKIKPKKLSTLQYGFESRSFNEKGELESELMLGFDFKQTEEGYKVCGVWIAG